MKTKFQVLISISVLSMFTFMLVGCSADKQIRAAAQSSTVKTITLASASHGLTGKVAVNETVEIYSTLQGRIASILVDEGAKVKKGDMLVQIETSDIEVQVSKAQAGLSAAQAKLADTLAGARKEDLRADQGALDAAKAGVDQAKASFDLIEIAYNQSKNGYDKGEVTKDELNKATSNYKTAKAGLEAAAANAASAEARLALLKAGATTETIDQLRASVAASQADLDAATLNLQHSTIISPIDGIVSKKYAKAGEMAYSSMPTGASLLQLVSLDPVKVEVSVPEAELQQIHTGDVFDVQVPSLPDKKFKGTVSFISPVSDPNNNTFTVKFIVANPDNLLRAGNVVNIKLAGDAANRVEIPKDSLMTKEGKTVIYKLDGDRIHEIAVSTEEKNQDWVYVKDGGAAQLKDEDKIVISPPTGLSDGSKVIAE